jgi:excisionase family DNA binding protein
MKQRTIRAEDDEIRLRSIAEFCEVTGVNPNTARKWIWQGRLRTVKLGGRRMIPMAELRRICSEGLPDQVEPAEVA